MYRTPKSLPLRVGLSHMEFLDSNLAPRRPPGFRNCLPEVSAIPNARSASLPKPYAIALPAGGGLSHMNFSNSSPIIWGRCPEGGGGPCRSASSCPPPALSGHLPHMMGEENEDGGLTSRDR